MAAIPAAEFETEVGEWRERVHAENERVTMRLGKAADKAVPAVEGVPSTEAAGSTAAMASQVVVDTRREAVLFSVGANADHGLRRSNADKRRTVLILLNDTEWARRCTRRRSAQDKAGKPRPHSPSLHGEEMVPVADQATPLSPTARPSWLTARRPLRAQLAELSTTLQARWPADVAELQSFPLRKNLPWVR